MTISNDCMCNYIIYWAVELVGIFTMQWKCIQRVDQSPSLLFMMLLLWIIVKILKWRRTQHIRLQTNANLYTISYKLIPIYAAIYCILVCTCVALGFLSTSSITQRQLCICIYQYLPSLKFILYSY